MNKGIVITAMLSFFVAMPVSADWESLKEKAKALGEEAVDFTKETWDSTEDWRKDVKGNVETWSKEAKEKKCQLD